MKNNLLLILHVETITDNLHTGNKVNQIDVHSDFDLKETNPCTVDLLSM